MSDPLAPARAVAIGVIAGSVFWVLFFVIVRACS